MLAEVRVMKIVAEIICQEECKLKKRKKEGTETWSKGESVYLT